MSDFLKQMADASAARAAKAQRRYSDDELDMPVVSMKLNGFDVIAELKEHSPAEGELAGADNDRLAQASRYVKGGAAAVSVLTEPTRFGGDLVHLREVAALLAGAGVPAMRKDFLVEPAQLLEARAAGASGALLITAMLDDAKLRAMLDCAFEHSLFVLLEAFDEDDLRRARDLMQLSRYAERATERSLLFGVNTRNLRTLAVDPDRLERLRTQLPQGALSVAESGIKSADDAARAAGFGYDAVLVGTALMRSADPTALVRDILAAGRARCAA
ncbi:MAG: indole-3-glycerol-phosphate synthase [Woeseia sp.]|nr:indole-3-glycerol-phosphate synthase [Woeseia sp.]NNL54746.1 indole-3-glycerol-phosphate synthase [Woeseia sp.]